MDTDCLTCQCAKRGDVVIVHAAPGAPFDKINGLAEDLKDRLAPHGIEVVVIGGPSIASVGIARAATDCRCNVSPEDTAARTDSRLHLGWTDKDGDGFSVEPVRDYPCLLTVTHGDICHSVYATREQAEHLRDWLTDRLGEKE